MHYIVDTIKYLLQSNTVNFLLMVGLLWYIVKKFDLISSIDNSIKNVSLSIKKSDDEMQKSKQTLKLIKEDIEKLPAEIQRIQDETEEKAQSLKKQIESSATKTIEHIKSSVPKILSIEEKKISNDIVDETVKHSLTQAEKDLLKILDSNPELHNKFIEDSLADLDRVKL